MAKTSIKRWLGGLLATAAMVGLAGGLGGDAAAQGKTRLTVYTALENDQLGPYKAAFEQDNPNIDIAWVRDSTGVMTARLIAEKDNPRADVIWGLSASSVVLFQNQGMLIPYTPVGADQLKPVFRDSKSPMGWTGMDAYLSVVCFNTVEAAKDKLATPQSWQDLTNPIYKGKVVMPNPASSGTGYLTVAAWLQLMGEQKGWEFMDKLHENVAVYTHSGSAPCVQAARGERLMGIGFDMRGASEKTKGAPIDIILPKEGAGWEMEATAIVKGTKNLAAAQKLVDWTVTRKANEMYGKYYAIVAAPGINAAPPNYPANAEQAMVKNDLGWMASSRERILAEWTKRYDSKSAPK
ncbi:MAG: putative 2-aminoethylphosphonate ABC transporter substrate-binding protein [Rhodospirillales bacterium]|nr:putative 2-aminoethylphosphonate ABC transporter substrate-binding protein [Rhodospirillales bacterium]